MFWIGYFRRDREISFIYYNYFVRGTALSVGNKAMKIVNEVLALKDSAF
jgi:hypothetical protein